MDVNIFKSLLNDFRYIVLPGKCSTDSPYINLYNKAYLYWKIFWTEVFADKVFVPADNFLRQDFIPVILHKDKIVAIHLYTIFTIFSLSVRDHSYFDVYPASFFQNLEKNHVKTVMSIEYLTANPAWRKSIIGISLAEVMIGASLKYLDYLNMKAAIASTRNDRKVKQMCYNFGFDCFQAGLLFHGYEIVLVVGYRGKVTPHPNNEIEKIISYFWNNKIDGIGQFRN